MYIKFYHYLEKEDNFIAGHSMGGYGTIKFALTQSDKFAKAAPLSAVFEAQRFIDLDWTDFSLNLSQATILKLKVQNSIHTIYLIKQSILM